MKFGLKLGADYNTAWARTGPARFGRRLMIEGITRPMVKILAQPTLIGVDRLEEIKSPVIFAINHSSHLDTSLTLTALPPRFRRTTAVAARSDYFFDKHWKAALWSLWMNVIPLERDKANRASIETAESLLKSGWSLAIFPEGTRGEDDFSVDFKPGAAYISIRADVPVVPVHLEGTRSVFTPYTRRLKRGRTQVTFGAALRPQAGERARDFNQRIQSAVAEAADEGRTDWWGARRRAAALTTPTLQGPDGVSGWRRNWAGSKPTSDRRVHHWPT